MCGGGSGARRTALSGGWGVPEGYALCRREARIRS
jgi:hypothetical protein